MTLANGLLTIAHMGYMGGPHKMGGLPLVPFQTNRKEGTSIILVCCCVLLLEHMTELSLLNMSICSCKSALDLYGTMPTSKRQFDPRQSDCLLASHRKLADERATTKLQGCWARECALGNCMSCLRFSQHF